jgi:methylenetetrahydrofolate dehydrogenase (NADP+)/methenyltetrahydrofolate cyclohydrolase
VSAELLDGKAQAEIVRETVQAAVDELETEHGFRPRLDAILAGDNEASELYVEKKQEDCEEVGITSRLHRFGTDVTTDELVDHVEQLNADDDVDGMIVQLPLPEPVDEERVLEAVDPTKDADGFHPVNLGRLTMDRSPLTPATPTGILHLLEAYEVDLEGADVVIVGRSTIVGKPMALLLLQRGVDATVAVAHSRTDPLAAKTREADVVVAAAGVPELVTADMVAEGATVVDVGINRTDEGNLVGDVAFDEVADQADLITPVPGGVGPLTRAFLLVNVVRCACERRGLEVPKALQHVLPTGLASSP